MTTAGGTGLTLLQEAATALGSSEAALRLILSIFIGYPLALFERCCLFGKEAQFTYLFHIVTGLLLSYFNFGYQIYHFLLCVVLQFLILRLMGRTITAVLTSFSFQMIYLLGGYYYTATDEYDIKWTMPHCVLTLRMIGLAFDYYDGGKVQATLSQEQQQCALPSVPSFLQVAGFSYFYGGFLVGPQFSLRSYQKLAEGIMTDVEGQRPNSLMPAAKRLSLGLFYLTVFAILSPYLPDSYFLTDEFLAQPFWYRCVYITVWGKIMLCKYLTCWLVTEGVCILTGLGYSGKNADGRPRWDACANVKVWLFETTPLFTGTIASFNINTNAWVARNVFKRLRFLGNKTISQAAALLFLAVWHGLHSGYLMCFALEFLIVVVEKQVIDLVRESPLLTSLTSVPALKLPLYVVQQSIHWLCMGYPLVPFCLFTWDKWLRVYLSVYFIGHVLFLSLLFALPLLRKVLVPRKERLKKAE
ncbi:lysophospholipid acyltransferase 5 [Rhinatrema bivittatum]|uniref:lysophospholipid acyltransferase 5 n=1 Tax=Rhinatrema bivittatum TaxID=194408 RepID=UPI00112E08AD|nr:lysophospholipid acyltransferase 5 [Rhinatrema bivittatum]